MLKNIPTKLIIFFSLSFMPTVSTAATIVGDAPICNSAEAADIFRQAVFNLKSETIEKLIISGDCVFVYPDLRALVIEASSPPKVMVYIPYKKPLMGWTTSSNIK